MCVPISVVTKGKVSGCYGICRLWLHIGSLLLLGTGLIWNFTRRFISKKAKN